MRWAWVGVTVAWVSVVGVARAEPERVELRDGTVLQGELVEKVPGDHVTLKLATGEIRRIEQGAIAEPRATGPQSSIAPVRDPGVQVSIQSDHAGTTLMRAEAVGLVQTTNGYSTYAAVYEQDREVCVAPCSASLDRSSFYWIAGDSVTTSSRFLLPNGVSSLKVRTGSSAMHGWGGVAVTFGALALLYAAVTIPIGLLVNANNSDGSPNGTRNAVLYSGIGTLIGGVALLALGIPLVAISNTHVTTDTGRDLARIRLTATGLVF